MKTTINKKELIEFEACEDGFDLFVETHGDKTVNLSQCLDSNSLDDVLWLLRELDDRGLLSAEQLKGLRLFAADCAESVLHLFESEYPEDKRPRLAIQASRDFANGLIESAALAATRSSARAAASSAAWSATSSAARDATRSAAWAAAWSATSSAARDATRSAARDATRSAAWAAAWAAVRAATSSAALAATATRDAARAGVRDAQSKQLESLLVKWERGE